MDVTTEFFTFVEVVGHWLFHSLVASEKFAFLFWFAACGAAMWYLAVGLFPKRRILRVVAVVFYSFNFYAFYNWEIARIGEISATVLLPIVLGAYVRFCRRQYDLGAFAVAIAVASVVGMGIGVQPPEMLVALLFLIACVLYEAISSRAIAIRGALYRRAIAVLVCLAVTVGINAIWILPELHFIFSSGYTNTKTGIAVFSVDRLLEWTSRHASLLNNFMIAGRTVFYDVWGGTPYEPLLYGLLRNPLLHALGLALPLAAFASLFVSTNRWLRFFAGAALASIFLSKGVHPPFGQLYGELVRHFPGFWIIRAPWEKFALVTAICYSIMIGTTAEYAAIRAGRWARSRIKLDHAASRAIFGVAAVFVVFIVAYDYPLVLGGNFPEPHGRLPGFHQVIPTYLYDAANWVNKQKGNFRIIPMPDDRVNIYRWGYAAPLDISYRLIRKPILDRQYGEGTAPPAPVFGLYNELSSAIYRGNGATAAFLGRLLSVRYYLDRKDIVYDFYGGRNDSPSFIASRLSLIPGVRRSRSFGQWTFYRASGGLPHLYATDNIAVTSGVERAEPVAHLLPADTAYLLDRPGPDGDGNPLSHIHADLPIADVFSRLDPVIAATRHPLTQLFYSFDQPVAFSARRYPGVKAVVETSGRGRETMLWNRRANYLFFGKQRSWRAYNSTLIFIETGAIAFPLREIVVDGYPANDIVGVVWTSGWVGFGSRPLQLPVVIPPHQRAIVQVNHLITARALDVVSEGHRYRVAVQSPAASHAFSGFRATSVDPRVVHFSTSVAGAFDISLAFSRGQATDRLMLQLDGRPLYPSSISIERAEKIARYRNVQIKFGTHELRLHAGARLVSGYIRLRAAIPPFVLGGRTSSGENRWDEAALEPAVSISAGRYPGWKAVIRSTGSENGALVWGRQNAFRLFNKQREWLAYNSTLVYIKTGAMPFRIQSVEVGKAPASDIVGIAWSTGYEGFGTRPLRFPTIIPPHERGIIQINHLVRRDLSIISGKHVYHIPITGARAARMHVGFAAMHVEADALPFRVAVTGEYRLLLRLAAHRKPRQIALRVDGVLHKYSVTRGGNGIWDFKIQNLRLAAGPHLVAFSMGVSVLDGLAQLQRVSDSLRFPIIPVQTGRISPTSEAINIRYSHPFVLVFGDNFNSGWRLFRGHPTWWQVLFTKGASPRPFLVNGYANGWYVDAPNETRWTIIFWPQSLLVLGAFLTAISLLAVAGTWAAGYKKHWDGGSRTARSAAK
ncbi:MAG: hypothetical protein ACYDFS_02525 [Vulcanimicrobiaceae bacterium]